DRLTVELHVAVFLGGLLEDRLDLLHGLAAVLLKQDRDVLLAVERRELLRQVRPLPAQVDPLQAVVQVAAQRQARGGAGGLVRAPRRRRAEERLVLLAEAVGDALAERPELVAAEVVALEQLEGPG